MDLYGLTAKQREAVETLLEHGDVLTSSSHSLAITNADVQSIINGLPSSLPQKRKDVVKNAGSLVGKVNYFGAVSQAQSVGIVLGELCAVLLPQAVRHQER